MADPVIHIKDAYFFEIPKVLWPRNFKSKEDVFKVSKVWVELDDQYQDWEFHKQYDKLASLGVVLPPQDQALHDWHEWREHDHAHEGKPFDEFLAAKKAEGESQFNAWKAKQVAEAKSTEDRIDAGKADYLEFKQSGAHHPGEYDSFIEKSLEPKFAEEWTAAKREQIANASQYIADHQPDWSEAKLQAYSKHLAGKILIPQPFAQLRNLHENEHGIAISKYMIVEVVVALLIAILFSWLARRVIAGTAPKGRMWNFLEVFVVFIRTQIAEPAIGGGHDDHGHGDHGHGDHGHGDHGHEDHVHGKSEPGHHVDASGHAVANAAHAHGHEDHGHAPKKHGHVQVSPATKFTPLLCSIFFFILGCNLAGMLPWIGAPTSAWAVTLAMALVTFSAVVIAGMVQFGVLGFFSNLVPTMDMPWYMAIVLKPAIFVIEFGGLLIKHAVLSVRLLANMVAGHLVLLAILALAFGAEAAAQFTTEAGVSSTWWIASIPAILGCTALSMLELFVAFLQAFVFTLLSALFIGASLHKH